MATSMIFQFYKSDDNIDWDGPYNDIADVPDSRYIKVKPALERDASQMPVLDDMTVGYFKKSESQANWVYFNYTKKDVAASYKTKQWASKADWDGGSLNNLICPSDLTRLELKELALSGTGEYTLDVGLGKKAKWIAFSKTQGNANVWLRDYCSDLVGWTKEAGIWVATGGYILGSGTVNYPDNGLYRNTNWKNADIKLKVWKEHGSAGIHVWVRQSNHDNGYLVWNAGGPDEDGDEYIAIGKIVNDEIYDDNGSDYTLDNQTWYWWRIQVYDSGAGIVVRVKSWKVGTSEPGSWAHTWTESPRTFNTGGIGLGKRWHPYNVRYDDILVSCKDGTPSPPGTSIYFQFYSSENGNSWEGPYSDIANVPESRYLKVKISMSRNNQSSAMPYVDDMTVGYFLKGA